VKALEYNAWFNGVKDYESPNLELVIEKDETGRITSVLIGT
jgi:hypothetical protein